MVKIKNISLVNIVAGRTIVPEMIQGDVTVGPLVNAARTIMNSPDQYNEMKEQLNIVRQKLGGIGASANVAEAVLAI